MNNNEIKKFIDFLKAFPEHHSMMKRLLLDYLALKDENKKLVDTNLLLLEDVRQYENLIRKESEITIH
jgi:hypothetical protein